MSEMGNWFVSHCSKDIQVVEQIVDVLKDCGIPYWKAPEMIPAGSNYAKEIPKAIKGCSVFLIIVSEASQESIWVEKELDSAINARKKIVPVKIDDAPLCDMFTFYMNNVQMIDIQVRADDIIAKSSLQNLYKKFRESIPKQPHLNETGPAVTEVKPDIDVVEYKTFIENPVIDDELERRKIENRKNAFRINKIPVFCDKCNRELENVDVGTYSCPVCNRLYYDDFTKIRNFIESNGPSPAHVIAKGTGLPKETIRQFFSDDAKL